MKSEYLLKPVKHTQKNASLNKYLTRNPTSCFISVSSSEILKHFWQILSLHFILFKKQKWQTNYTKMWPILSLCVSFEFKITSINFLEEMTMKLENCAVWHNYENTYCSLADAKNNNLKFWTVLTTQIFWLSVWLLQI